MEDTLTLKTLQTHLTKTTITSIVSSVMGVLILAVVFYFNTINVLANHETKINEVIATQSVQGTAINEIKITEAEGKINQANFERSIEEIKQNQKETNSLILQLLQGQKTMIKQGN